jgi:hypothetical protein
MVGTDDRRKVRFASSLLNRVTKAYKSTVRSLERNPVTEVEIFEDEPHIDLIYIDRVTVDMPIPAYTTDVTVQEQARIGTPLDNLSFSLGAAAERMHSNTAAREAHRAHLIETLENIVAEAKEARNLTDFKHSMRRLRDEGVTPAAAVSEHLVGRLRELGYVNLDAGETRNGNRILREARDIDWRADFGNESRVLIAVPPSSDEYLYMTERGMYQHIFFPRIDHFDLAEAVARVQYKENLIDYLQKEYAFNRESSIDSIRREAKRLYRMPVDVSDYIYAVRQVHPGAAEPEFGTDDHREHFANLLRRQRSMDAARVPVPRPSPTRLPPSPPGASQSLEARIGAAGERLGDSLESITTRRIIRGAAIGAATATVFLAGGPIAALGYGLLAWGGGYIAQAAGNLIARYTGEQFAGSALGLAGTLINASQGDYIGTLLNGSFAALALGAGLSSRSRGPQNSFTRTLSKAATVMAGVAAVYNLFKGLRGLAGVSIDPPAETGIDLEDRLVDDVVVPPEETVVVRDGLSAYEIAVKHGFVGSEQEWLESLKATCYTCPDKELPAVIEEPPVVHYDIPKHYTISFNQGPKDIWLGEDCYGTFVQLGPKTAGLLGDDALLHVQYDTNNDGCLDYTKLISIADGRAYLPNASDVQAFGVGRLISPTNLELSASETMENIRNR